jgi:Tfp pilus assembly protein PilP
MSSLILLFSLLVLGAGAVSAQPEELRMWMTVGERRFAITLTDNAAARAFAAQLPLTLDMSELNGNEKHADLPKPLPANASRPGTIRNGDLMLYPGGLLRDVSVVLLVHPPWSSGRPFRPATDARLARCSSRVF